MNRCTPVVAVAVVVLAGQGTLGLAQQPAPVVAVFTIQDKTGEHTAEVLQQQTEYLTAKMAEGGQFQVVPSSQVKDRLVQQKKESYKECYDEKCQIDLGRELAAQKSLSSQIVKVGTSCVVVSTLFDLRRAVSESAASEKGGCTKEAIAAMVERVAASLKAQAQLRAGPGVGGLLVKSNPPGGEVFLDGAKANGTTPLSIPFVKEGEHALMVTKGDYRFVGKVKVVANQIVTASCGLELVSAVAEREKAERERRLIESRQAIALARNQRRSKTIWGLTAVGIAGAAAVSLGALYGVGFSSRSDADAKYTASTTQEEMNRNYGSPMPVRKALQLINQTLDECLAEQEGEFDGDTRFAVTWYETHGMEPGPFGTAETLATARAISVQGVVEAGVLEAKGGKVRLLKRAELPDDWDPETDKRLTVWEATQHLIKRLETQGESGAAELLRKLGGVADAARDLCYRLYTLCERKKWAEEAQHYNGLIVAWPEISKLAAQARGSEQKELFS